VVISEVGRMAIELDSAVDALSNVVALEHVNVQVPDQARALAFYVDGLGLTRDPELQTGTTNMWINVGRSQFHLPTGKPQVLRGHVGLVLPGREGLVERLASLSSEFAGTEFQFSEGEEFVEVTSPWGNRFRCFDHDARFGDAVRGMAYVAFDVPVGTAAAIARFYREMLDATTEVDDEDGATSTSSFARPTPSSVTTTGTTCRSTSQTTLVPTPSSRRAASPMRRWSTSSDSRTSSTSTTTRCSSRSNTRFEARATRFMAGHSSTAASNALLSPRGMTCKLSN
jgi:catechol 2,3-dioxygenase-like lactoylglutathione lyase family enzyme